MLMKIVTGVLIVLLIGTLGAAAMFYLNTFKPMDADYARMKTAVSELDKAKSEIKKLKEMESARTAWMKPVIDTVSAGLGDEIKAGHAEVLTAGDKVVVNISEKALFLDGAYTFAQESPQVRTNLAALLKDKFQDKDIYIGNTSPAVPAQVKKRKKIPGKDARTLSSERSAFLIRDLEKNGVHQDKLIAVAFPAKDPGLGLQIKGHKTIILIENKPQLSAVAVKQEAAPVAAPVAKSTATAPSTTPPAGKLIPIQSTPPKAQ